MSKFGGPASKAAMSVGEAIHANVLEIRRGTWPNLNLAKVMLTGSGKEINGVVWGADLPRDADLSTYIGMSVTVMKAGGRWIILQ